MSIARQHSPSIYLQANPDELAFHFYKHLGFGIREYGASAPVVPSIFSELNKRDNTDKRFVDFKPYELLSQEKREKGIQMLAVMCKATCILPYGTGKLENEIYDSITPKNTVFVQFPFSTKKEYLNNLTVSFSVLGVPSFDFYPDNTKKTTNQSNKPNRLYEPNWNQCRAYLHNSQHHKLDDNVTMYPVFGKMNYGQYDQMVYDARRNPAKKYNPTYDYWLTGADIELALHWMRRNPTSELTKATVIFDSFVTDHIRKFTDFHDLDKEDNELSTRQWVGSDPRRQLLESMKHVHAAIIMNPKLLEASRIFLYIGTVVITKAAWLSIRSCAF